jgi:alkylation response protein AidB-like acyl-CoA dehydrogenase
VFFNDVKLPAGQRLAGDATEAFERRVQRGIAALCAEAVGAMEATNAATIEYTKSRKQFGQPIGRFRFCSTAWPTCSSRPPRHAR